MSLAQPSDPSPETTDVLVVGAGPAGLMLATQLARAGIPLKILDDRPTKTITGRADGLQPKTIETLKQLRLADPILKRGAKIYDISFWNSYPGKVLHRTSREVHYPSAAVDVLEPYVLLGHQGMVEDLFLDDMAARGVYVERSSVFQSYAIDEDPDAEFPVVARYLAPGGVGEKMVRAKYLVGCDGAHSAVRRNIPGVVFEGESVDVFWGVLDGVIETDFPDLWSKCAISSHDRGTIMCIPRERNMTRLYIELSSGSQGTMISKEIANQDFVMARAREILSPFHLEWRRTEWFGVYQIGQRIASTFTDSNRVFLAGDASHTHSPKAAQGMNVSMHDTFNLSWKLSLVLSSLSPPSLLSSYATERRKIAQDLISFDYEHAKAFVANDQAALAENFRKNIRFISGVGVVYDANTPLTMPTTTASGLGLVSGELLLPAKATRFIDANPVNLELDVPLLNQFRVYFLTSDYHASKALLVGIVEDISRPESIVSRASRRSLSSRYVPATVEEDEFVQPDRYTPSGVSRVFTFCVVTSTPQAELEFTDLVGVLGFYKWTFYIDGLGRGVSPLAKWGGRRGVQKGEVMGVVVRPDGYVGGVEVWGEGMGKEAAEWFKGYFEGVFLE